MRIRMNPERTMAGPHGTAGPGQEADVPDNIGRAIVDAGHAVEVVPAPAPAEDAVETASDPAPAAAEDASTRTEKRGRKTKHPATR